MISATARNNVIGYNGRIPWNIPEDKAFFRQVTTGGIVIMGRRTYEDIGRPLPNRFNIIVSRTKNFSSDNMRTAGSLEEAIDTGRKYNSEKDIFLCGGQKIYTLGMKYTQKIYLTEIDKNFDGDAFFPPIDSRKFFLAERRSGETDGISFCVYEAL